MASRRGNPTRQIELRQRAEDEVGRYATVAAEHTRLKMRSEWEQSSEKRMTNSTLFRTMDRAQARRDDILAARRERLADLLAREREQHEAMLESMVVTDDQRREKLMQKARDLRVQREELRQQEAQTKKDELFRQRSVLVREAESRIKVLSVAQQRQEQIEQQARMREEQALEDQFFTEQAQAQQHAQTLRAQRDLETLRVRAQKMRQDLDLQLQHDEQRRAEEKARQQREDADFAATLKAGIQSDSAADQARRLKQRQIADATKARNLEINAQREAELKKHRDAEKAELDALLAQIADDERQEGERKKRAREDAATHMKLVEAQMSAAAASETALDKRWQEENDRQWEKREGEWSRHADQRHRLLEDVFATRKAQVLTLREKEQQDLEAKRRAREQAIEEARAGLHADLGSTAARRQAAEAHKSFLATQVSRKEAERARERDSKRTELTSSQADEAMYQAKIQAELAKLEEAKPAEYKHVRLVSGRRVLM